MSDQLKWFKSSHSDDEGGDCVEVAFSTRIHIRDSKVPTGPELHLAAPPGRRSFPQFSPELEPRVSSSAMGFLGFWAG